VELAGTDVLTSGYTRKARKPVVVNGPDAHFESRHSPHGSPFIAKDFRNGRPACQQFASRTALQGRGITRKIGVSSTVMAWIRSRRRKDGTTIQQVNWRDRVSNKQYAETFAAS